MKEGEIRSLQLAMHCGAVEIGRYRGKGGFPPHVNALWVGREEEA